VLVASAVPADKVADQVDERPAKALAEVERPERGQGDEGDPVRGTDVARDWPPADPERQVGDYDAGGTTRRSCASLVSHATAS
jgi:hypothetical protein